MADVEDLRALVRERRVLVVVGAGVSIQATGNAACASWTGLLRDGAARAARRDVAFRERRHEIVLREIDSGDLDNMCSAAEKIARALGAPREGEYGAWLRDSVGKLAPRDPAVLEALRDLGAPIATTNYDGLLEAVTGLRPLTWQDPDAVNFSRGDRGAILHLHGHWKDCESVVLGIRSYERVIADVTAQAVIDALWLSKTVLFVGCGAGLEDPNFEQLRERLAPVVRRSTEPAYRLALQSEVATLQSLHRKEERIVVVPYGDRHQELIPFLRGLAPAPPSRSGVAAAAAVAAARPFAPTPDAVLAAYRSHVQGDHAAPGGLFAEFVGNLDTVYVELAVEEEIAPGGGAAELVGPGRIERGRAGVTLRELLDRPGVAGRAARWVVLGEPGAGKSTMARHLARTLAGADGPLAVYAPLPLLAAGGQHPFDFVEEELCTAIGEAEARGLAGALRELGRHPGRVFLLLDGLDEVGPGQRAPLAKGLRAWAQALPNVAIAVLSRPVGYEPLGAEYPAQARVQPLDRDRQQQLLGKWLPSPAAAAEVWAAIAGRHALREACQVPLLLALLAYLRRKGQAIPGSRRQLFHQAIDILLSSGYREGDDKGVRDPIAARVILGELSLSLQAEPAESWKLETLRERARALREESPLVRAEWEPGSWATAKELFDDIGGRSGVLAAHDGPASPWRFLHRQFRELLAAEALHRQGRDAVLARARALRPQDLPRWAEVLGFACELSEQPLDLLRALFAVSEELGLRVLPEVEGVNPIAALGTLRSKEGKAEGGWDGDFLLGLFARWREQGGFKQEDVAGWLWQQVAPARSTSELAYLHYALEALEGQVARERFFTACGRWPDGDGGPARPKLVEIRGGTFMMGSPEGEPERSDYETPHEVTVALFLLGATAVSNEEYERFDPSHERETFGGKLAARDAARHPVVNISWWEAYLYARWLGLRLPTEAEWEYACRAGTTTPFSFGKNVTPAQVNYDGDFPYVGGKKGEDRGRTVEVGSLPANGWGLHEMHGNVREWCRDWYGGDYETGPATDPPGAESGHGRVVRGGSWNGRAGGCRSACRDSGHPAVRVDFLGLRLAAGQDR